MRRYLPVGLWIGVRAGLDPYNNINNVKCSPFPHDNVHNDNDAVVPHLVMPGHDAPLPKRRIAVELQWQLLSCCWT